MGILLLMKELAIQMEKRKPWGLSILVVILLAMPMVRKKLV